MLEKLKYFINQKQNQTQKRNMDYNKWQLEELDIGRKLGFDIIVYGTPQLKPYEMEAARDALLSGASPSIVRKIIAAYIRADFDESRYNELMENAIYVTDLDFLRDKYHLSDIPTETRKPFKRDVIYGAVFGDIAGSRYEFSFNTNIRKGLNVDNCIGKGSTYTDDTILTCATAIVIKNPVLCIEQKDASFDDYCCASTYPFVDNPFVKEYREQTISFPGVGYGPGFYQWAIYNHDTPYGSFGNGAAMRVSTIGAYFDDIDDVIVWAAASSAATHNHPEGIKGAIITSVCVWMALNGYSKYQIYQYMWDKYRDNKYGFESFSMDELHHPKKPDLSDASCMFSVPAAVICFYYSSSFDEMMNHVLSFNGDTDTIGAIAGGIGAAYYGIPSKRKEVVEKLKPEGIFDDIINIFGTK